LDALRRSALYFSLLAPLAVLLCAHGTSAGVESQATYTAAMKAYNSREYHRAAELFGMALKENDDNPIGHYYLANTYVKIKEFEKAAGEYKECYETTPDEKLAQYCLQAYNAIARKTGEVVIDEAARADKADAGLAPPVRSTFYAMKNQATGARDHHKDQLNQLIFQGKRQQEDEMIKLKEEESRLTEGVPKFYPRMGGQVENPDWEQQVKAATADVRNRIAQLQKDHKRRQAELEQVIKTKEVALSGLVRDLKTQMDHKNGHSIHRLSPYGTNIYVRRYASTGQDSN
jgi:tetratricopeptide (TPR) repeat protein